MEHYFQELLSELLYYFCDFPKAIQNIKFKLPYLRNNKNSNIKFQLFPIPLENENKYCNILCKMKHENLPLANKTSNCNPFANKSYFYFSLFLSLSNMVPPS